MFAIAMGNSPSRTSGARLLRLRGALAQALRDGLQVPIFAFHERSFRGAWPRAHEPAR